MMTNPTGRVTQGQFSFLPDLTDAEIRAQIDYGLGRGYAWSIEYTDDPHPRNTYWEMFGNPMFDLRDPAGILREIQDYTQQGKCGHDCWFYIRRQKNVNDTVIITILYPLLFIPLLTVLVACIKGFNTERL